jgi:hypothetical protein
MTEQALRERFQRISQHLDEKARRLWCANEAIAIGLGGVSFVAVATGVSRTTITEGVKEIRGRKDVPKERVRRKGGGRKPKTERDENLKRDVEKLVEPHMRGEPECPLKWTSKSTRKIAKGLDRAKKRASHSLVSRILSGLGYRLQANRKTDEGAKDNPDRNAQFEFINKKAKEYQEKG